MADPRRVGNAQRRRMGAPSSMYSSTTKPPSYGVGDMVKATGRYGPQRVDDIVPNGAPPDHLSDGHIYVVSGGKGGKQTTHLSGELSPFEMGMEELD